MWKVDEKNVYGVLEDFVESNRSKIEPEHDVYYRFSKKFINSMFRVASHISWSLGNGIFTGHGFNEKAIFSAYIKNLYLFYSILELTNNGLFGPARNLMRSAYEALLIGKYCAISGESEFLGKWLQGDHQNVTNDVLNKINNPTEELRFFLKTLNPFSHASIYSQQIEINYEEIKNEIITNYSLIYILLDMNFHLLNRHWITPKTIYYTNRYRESENFDLSRKEARKLASGLRKSLKGHSKKLAQEFSAKWELK